jgi:hypothetical protein
MPAAAGANRTAPLGANPVDVNDWSRLVDRKGDPRRADVACPVPAGGAARLPLRRADARRAVARGGARRSHRRPRLDQYRVGRPQSGYRQDHRDRRRVLRFRPAGHHRLGVDRPHGLVAGADRLHARTGTASAYAATRANGPVRMARRGSRAAMAKFP